MCQEDWTNTLVQVEIIIIIPHILCSKAPQVSLQFEQEMYTVNEVAGSQALAVLVCLVADNTERNYTVVLRPLVTTATRRAIICVTWTIVMD